VEIDFGAMEEVLSWLREIRAEFRWVWVEAELEAAREYGHVFPLVRLGEQRLGYIKVGLSRAYVTDFESCVAIPPASAFIYDTFVHPDFRGRGMATFMIARTLDLLRQRNVRFLWCHIPRWNHASIKAFAKCGFAKVKRVGHVRVLGHGLYTRCPEKLMQHAEKAWAQRGEGVR
jgi:ribosomal protein S18 acetylase RimI-like enzyme